MATRNKLGVLLLSISICFGTRAMTFLEVVREYSRDPVELVKVLSNRKDAESIAFCACFNSEAPVDNFRRISNIHTRTLVKDAAYIVAQNLFNIAKQKDAEGSISFLEEAQKFASILDVENKSSDGFFDKDDEYCEQNLKNVISSTLSLNKNLVDSLKELSRLIQTMKE